MARRGKGMRKSGLQRTGSTRIRTPMSGYRIKGHAKKSR